MRSAAFSCTLRAALSLLIATGAACGYARASAATTLYVATTGSDRNPGTVERPLRTISAAAARASVGRQVLVRGGVYRELLRIERSGTAAAPVRFSPYPGEQAIIDGAGAAAGRDLVRIGANHVVFAGFEVRNATGSGIDVDGAHHVTIADNIVHDNYLSGILVEGAATASHDNLVTRNAIYNNCLTNQSRRRDAGWPAALQSADSASDVFSENRVHQNYGEGISALRATGAQILRNVAYDNYSMNIYLDNAPSAVVEGNFSYATGDERFMLKGDQRPIGVGAANERYDAPPLPLADIVIKNNITVGTRFGFYYGNYELGGGLHDTLIAHNTFANATDAAIFIASDKHSGTQVVNNVMFSDAGRALALGDPKGVSFSHNCWAGGDAPKDFLGQGDKRGDPMLARPGALEPSGYTMSPASDCARSAPRQAKAPVSFFGQERDDPTSMGASEP